MVYNYTMYIARALRSEEVHFLGDQIAQSIFCENLRESSREAECYAFL